MKNGVDDLALQAAVADDVSEDLRPYLGCYDKPTSLPLVVVLLIQITRYLSAIEWHLRDLAERARNNL